MEVICLQDEVFHSLIDKVPDHIREKYSIKKGKWISDQEAMKKPRINSKSTLPKFRDVGRIRFMQPKKKLILYDSDSMLEYLETNAKDVL